VARLATAQVMSALQKVDQEEVLRRIDVAEFIQPGPLWWAFDWASAREQAQRARTSEPLTPKEWTTVVGSVVLVDEIDKADASVPNGLLDALGHGRFDVPGHGAVTMHAGRFPLVVITTNEERSMPDAFLRRCLVLHLGLPDERGALIDTLVNRGRAHFENAAAAVLQNAAEQLASDREEHRKRDLSPPGLAEYIDLVRAVLEQYPDDEKSQIALLRRISKFMYAKHPKEHMR
jgi:MoxR-like ATPase